MKAKGDWTARTKREILRHSARLRKLLKYAPNASVEVGIFRDAQDYIDTGFEITPGYVSKIVLVAWIHDQGLTRNKKYKGFLEKAIYHNNYRDEFKQILKLAGNNTYTQKLLLEIFADEVVMDVRDNIDRNKIRLPANAAPTQRMKGGNTPMIDTKHLVQQIDAKVRIRHG